MIIFKRQLVMEDRKSRLDMGVRLKERERERESGREENEARAIAAGAETE